MKIKAVRGIDIAECAKMAITEWAKKPYSEKWAKRSYYLRLKEIFDASPRSCLCVSDGSNIVGFVFCRLVTWYDGKHANIEEMVVSGDCQDKGLGSQLLAALQEKIGRTGTVYADGITNKRSKAFEFFIKSGFRAGDWVYLSKKI